MPCSLRDLSRRKLGVCRGLLEPIFQRHRGSTSLCLLYTDHQSSSSPSSPCFHDSWISLLSTLDSAFEIWDSPSVCLPIFLWADQRHVPVHIDTPLWYPLYHFAIYPSGFFFFLLKIDFFIRYILIMVFSPPASPRSFPTSRPPKFISFLCRRLSH